MSSGGIDLGRISACKDLNELEAVRVEFLGKQGVISLQMKELGKLSPDERKAKGAELNQLKDNIANAIDNHKAGLEKAAIDERLKTEKIDLTIAPRPEYCGTLHPITAVTRTAINIFAEMGFVVAESSEVEDDFHNFTALNVPENHPARQMHDTFYLEGEENILLRTHTSSVQIRWMENNQPPYRIIAPGRTFRSDSDMTHTPMFHQIEGLVIEEGANMGHLKYVLKVFLQKFFGVQNIPMRFRPSFFPFTEPSAEMDIGCRKGKGELVIGEGDDWLEILGCGMVHPNVLKNVGIDPEKYQGFAFGMGIERLAMLKYGIPDLRTFFESDARWLSHYGFKPEEVI